MRTPRAQPCLLASMKPSAVPWNQVAIIRPSSCQTVRSRSHSPASRQTAQDSTSSRIARRESASSLTHCRLARQEAKSAVAITVLRRVPNVPSAMPSPTRRSPGMRMTARCSGDRIHCATRPAGDPNGPTPNAMSSPLSVLLR